MFKKIVLSLGITLVLSACTGKPPPFEDRVAAPPDTLVGTIEPLDQIDIYREGTHQLRTETDELILIQSSAVNLNRYLGKQVTLQGESKVALGSDRPVFKVSQVKSLEAEEEDESEKKEDQDEVKEVRKGPACGGIKKLPCAEGFLCELEGSEEGASGVCVSLNEKGQNPTCPFIPPPDCPEYKPGAFSQTGCPTRFVCAEEGSEGAVEEGDEADSNELGRVIDTITKYKNDLLDTGAIRLLQFEASPEISLIAVVYERENKKVKKLFEYSPSGPEFNFSEKALFRLDRGKWVLVSGEDLQKNKAIKTIYVGQ